MPIICFGIRTDQCSVWDIYNLITYKYQIINDIFCAYATFEVFANFISLITLASIYARIPSLIFFACLMFYWFFTFTLTLFQFCCKLHFLSSHLHLRLHKICFINVLNSFIPFIILNTFKCSTSILLRTHIVSNGSSTVFTTSTTPAYTNDK